MTAPSLPLPTGNGDVRVREAFRQAGRRVLREPAVRVAHEARVAVAADLPGSEALQASLVDMLYACKPDPAALGAVLKRHGIPIRLAPFVFKALRRAVEAGERLPRVSSLATRWCLLVSPALDVPRRALLCGVDDSRALAARAEAAVRAGDTEAEQRFLDHCLGARDTLAFMLARRALARRGLALSARWAEVFAALQGEVT
ncbi:hypothetical protein EII20_02290 [Comamonadaceae bacterium OH2545_COT-014]|nr:hypothetical protein EII20_02290 [Comamonadaceae bacterium OH2545_COT-014]